MTKVFHAIFENGVFRPIEPVDLPERCSVEVEVHRIDPSPTVGGLDAVYAVLGRRFDSGTRDVAARHDEHQP
ncbi:MAG: antitoxin family protein [Planctomycetes bacterium]|nr:antitoxin family protein [Planctomycetota bacterium]